MTLVLIPAAQLGLRNDEPDELPAREGYDVVDGCRICEQRDATIADLREDIRRMTAEAHRMEDTISDLRAIARERYVELESLRAERRALLPNGSAADDLALRAACLEHDANGDDEMAAVLADEAVRP